MTKHTSQFTETVPVYNYCLGIIINNVLFTLNVTGLENKFYGHPSYYTLLVYFFVCFVFVLTAADPMKNIQHLDNETYNELLINLALMCTMKWKKKIICFNLLAGMWNEKRL